MALNVRNQAVISSSYRRNGTQLEWSISILMALGMLLWSGWVGVSWIKASHHQQLLRLVVIGHRDYTSIDSIRQAILLLSAQASFMTLDVGVIQEKLKSLPGIKQVSVRKEWPDTLQIHILEYVPVAYWNNLYKVDADGISFREPKEWVNQQILPLLYGPEGSAKEVLDSYRTISGTLASSKYTLKMVTMSSRHSWQLVLDNSTRLELGRDNCIERLQRFIALYPLLQKQGYAENKRVSYVDLRYESGISVGWVALFIDPKAVRAP